MKKKTKTKAGPPNGYHVFFDDGLYGDTVSLQEVLDEMTSCLSSAPCRDVDLK